MVFVAARKNVGSRQTKPARLFPFPRGKGLGVRLPERSLWAAVAAGAANFRGAAVGGTYRRGIVEGSRYAPSGCVRVREGAVGLAKCGGEGACSIGGCLGIALPERLRMGLARCSRLGCRRAL